MRNLTLAIAGTLGLMTSTVASSSPLTDWTPEPYVTVQNAEWTKDAVIYQVNTRQFTPEGTFASAQKQLPRLKKLGVDIVWLMPIHPIGEKNRKGTLGSPYAVKDYFGVNPEFGTLDDLKAFVKEAHGMGMKVVLDLVANHTAWDHRFAAEHPDWYEKDWKGDFRPTPWWDWHDVIDLDWSRPEVRQHIGDAMEYWVREADIDGYRADVAGYVPIDFWEKARARLDAIKPVFMLAEWKSTELHRKAFDATYAWEWHVLAKNVAQGKADATAFYSYYSENESAWPREAMRLGYIENHDSNAWEGTQYENFGDALTAMTVLSFVHEGLAMIHNGQEACNAKRLEFFERDPINWNANPDCKMDELFTQLSAYKKANPALWNGKWGGRMVKLETDQPKQVLSFVRSSGANKIVGLFNMSNQPVTFTVTSAAADGRYAQFQSDASVEVKNGSKITLGAWEYQVLSANGD